METYMSKTTFMGVEEEGEEDEQHSHHSPIHL
jgi:hypothetical protein